MDGMVTVMPQPEFRKPIFNFIWMRPLHTPPEQINFLRVGQRGLVRVFSLIVATLFLAAVSSITVAFLFSSREPIQSILLAAFLATASVYVFRAWIVGTYVNDHGVKVIRIASTVVIPWSHVESIATIPTMWAVLGIPLGLRTPRVVIHTFDNQSEHTHVYLGSIDGILSQESLAIRESLVHRWWRAE